MTTYAFPAVTPNEVTITLVSNAKIFPSPFTGAIQTIDRGGERLLLTLSYRNLITSKKALLLGWLARMNGQQHRVTLPFHAVDNQGAFGGTPLVDGANQSGTSIDIKGCSNNITDWIVAGDVFSFNGEMKICSANASSDGSGLITVSCYPRIRVSPADNDPVETTTPAGTFLLAEPRQGISLKPGVFGDMNTQLIEDIA